MTEAFVAGPNAPWNSNWVFGGEKPSITSAEGKIQGIAQALAQLQNATEGGMSVSGGDESQISQIQAAIAGLDGEITVLEGEVAEAAKPTRPQLLSGGEFLNALQASQAGDGGAKMNMGGQGSQQFGSDGAWAQQQNIAGQTLAQSKANANKPGLQLVSGGVASSGDRLGKVDSKSDEYSKLSGELTLGATPQNVMHSNNKQMTPITVTGQVVPGSMMKDRLSSDSVLNVSESISKLNTRGGGEMKIHLNPDNLGQLTIHVATNGQDVGLKVHASSEGAKKILDESMNSLRESLAGQSLMLGKVDVSVMSNASGNNGDLNNGQPQQWAQNQNGSMDLNGNPNQGRENGARWERDSGLSNENRVARANVSSGTFGASRSRAAAANSRLDVMA